MIALFTDFGLTGPYTGQVKAVLAREAPGVPVVDLFADLPVGDPKSAAYLLAAYAVWFAPPIVLLAVVDPGVGSARRAIVVEADGRFYVGPENGLFEPVLRRAATARAWEIVWRPELLSPSFHGRDLFAPVAAKLAIGGAGPAILRETEISRMPDWPDDLPAIAYIDHFGNAMTGYACGGSAGVGPGSPRAVISSIGRAPFPMSRPAPPSGTRTPTASPRSPSMAAAPMKFSGSRSVHRSASSRNLAIAAR